MRERLLRPPAAAAPGGGVTAPLLLLYEGGAARRCCGREPGRGVTWIVRASGVAGTQDEASKGHAGRGAAG
jgi:hypothetical protein